MSVWTGWVAPAVCVLAMVVAIAAALRAHREATRAPAPPCGAVSPRLDMTHSDLRRIGFFDVGAARRRPKRPKPWRRVCVCELGHGGDWHRSDDGQVWHRSHALTAEQAAAQDEQLRRDVDGLVIATSTVRNTGPEPS